MVKMSLTTFETKYIYEEFKHLVHIPLISGTCVCGVYTLCYVSDQYSQL